MDQGNRLMDWTHTREIRWKKGRCEECLKEIAESTELRQDKNNDLKKIVDWNLTSIWNLYKVKSTTT